jgi:glycosyltransferase involved in cell wall biosynthesis
MFVSVVTPTYNRRAFIPKAIEYFKAQTWPQDQMEWIILDDGTDKVEDLFTVSSLTNVRYIALPEKLTIGAKRNQLNKLAKGDIIVCMDDDDYYPPDRVAHAVASLQTNPTCKIAGASAMYLHFADRKEVWLSGPFGPNHATNNTMAYWRSYTKDHQYDEAATHAEERSFTNDWTEPMVQLNPKSTVLMTCHANNTFDKRALLRNPASVMRLVSAV